MSKFYSFSLFLLLNFTFIHGQGLEGILVEEIPVSAEAIAADENLNQNSVTYRVFIDMAADYKLLSVIGSTLNPLIFKTTTEFYNEFLGNKIPVYSPIPTISDPVYYDSWVALGAYVGGRIVPLELDTDDGVADGFVADGSFAPLSFDPSNDFDFYLGFEMSPSMDGTSAGWDPENVIWFNTSGFDGYGEDNYICIGQFTTDGEFSMELSVTLSNTLTTEAEQWVLREILEDGQRISSDLAYPNQLPTVNLTSPTEGQFIELNEEITLSAEASDPDGTIQSVSFRYITFEGRHNQITNITQSPYSSQWTVLTKNIDKIYAIAIDDKYGRDTSLVDVSINVLPSVELTAPENGSEFTTGDIVSFEATASDEDGSISRVEFFVNNVKVGEETEAEYQFEWTSVAGIAEIKAVAIDDLGATDTSNVSIVTIKEPGNTNPEVSITSPSENDQFNSGEFILIVASASDPDEGDNISKVEFLVNEVIVGTVNESPFEFNWRSVNGGSTILTAKAFDTKGGSTTSGPVNINLNFPPSIELTDPLDGAEVTLNDQVLIAANPNDLDGTISKVEFYVNGVLVGEATSDPYEASWTADTLGSKEITAIAFDDRGASKTSEARVITVKKGVGMDSYLSSNIKVFPNPASQMITIEAKKPDPSGSLYYSIVNSHGQQIINGEFSNTRGGKYLETIDISSYLSGLYIVRVWSEVGVRITNQQSMIIVVQ
jgi:hypothetical protein